MADHEYSDACFCRRCEMQYLATLHTADTVSAPVQQEAK